MSNSFDFEEFKAQAIEKLKAGVPLSGKDGVLAPLLENLLNSALEGELDSHLDGVEREMGNRRNGHMSKQVQTSMGEITINTPRDRDGTFDPQVVRKREKILADSLADRIIGLYAIGNCAGDIYAVDYPINIQGNSHGRCLVQGKCLGEQLAGVYQEI